MATADFFSLRKLQANANEKIVSTMQDSNDSVELF
jgi:hypothetical protein